MKKSIATASVAGFAMMVTLMSAGAAFADGGKSLSTADVRSSYDTMLTPVPFGSGAGMAAQVDEGTPAMYNSGKIMTNTSGSAARR